MTNADVEFSGSIPGLYHNLLVPILFRAAAQDMARRVDPTRSKRILETAAGTGVVTEALAGALADLDELVATDLNQAMLELAQAHLASDPRISFRVADAQALPFANESFDLVVCQFGVMFFPDKPLGYREARRVLTSDGRYLFSVWDGLATNDFARVAHEAMAAIFPLNPPRFIERVPYGHHDLDQILRQVTEAGFRRVTTDPVDDLSTAPSARALATAYVQGTPLRAEIEARNGSLADVTAALEEVMTSQFGAGAISGQIRSFVISAEV